MARSPKYPTINLLAVLERAREIWNSHHRSTFTKEDAASSWNYSSVSGPVLSSISALKQYGLLEKVGTSGLRLTQRGIDLSVIEDSSSRDYQDALRSAALEPLIFSNFYNDHRNQLPSQRWIREDVIRNKEFTETGAETFAKVLHETFQLTQLYEMMDNGGEFEEGTLADGDFVQWESQGTLQFPEDKGRKIVGFSEDRQWAFIEGSDIGIPVEELELVRKVAVEQQQTEKTPPKSPFMAGEKPRSTSKEATFPVEEGQFVLRYPEKLSEDSIEAFEDWLNLILKQAKRSIETKPEDHEE